MTREPQRHRFQHPGSTKARRNHLKVRFCVPTANFKSNPTKIRNLSRLGIGNDENHNPAGFNPLSLQRSAKTIFTHVFCVLTIYRCFESNLTRIPNPNGLGVDNREPRLLGSIVWSATLASRLRLPLPLLPPPQRLTAFSGINFNPFVMEQGLWNTMEHFAIAETSALRYFTAPSILLREHCINLFC